MIAFLRYLFSDRPTYVTDWNWQIVDRLERSTQRYLGEPYEGCGPPTIVGNRIVEAREARVRQMRKAKVIEMRRVQ